MQTNSKRTFLNKLLHQVRRTRKQGKRRGKKVNLYLYFNQKIHYGMNGLCRGIQSDTELCNKPQTIPVFSLIFSAVESFRTELKLSGLVPQFLPNTIGMVQPVATSAVAEGYSLCYNAQTFLHKRHQGMFKIQEEMLERTYSVGHTNVHT